MKQKKETKLTTLSSNELKKVNGGGFFMAVLGALAGGLLYDIVSNPRDSASAFSKGGHDIINSLN